MNSKHNFKNYILYNFPFKQHVHRHKKSPHTINFHFSQLSLENIAHYTFHLNSLNLITKCNAGPFAELQRFIAVNEITVPSTKIPILFNLCKEEKSHRARLKCNRCTL